MSPFGWFASFSAATEKTIQPAVLSCQKCRLASYGPATMRPPGMASPSHRHPKSQPVSCLGAAFGDFGAFNLQVRHIIGEGGGTTTQTRMLREYCDRLAYWSGVRLVSVAAATGAGNKRASNLGDYRVSAPQVTPGAQFQRSALSLNPSQQLVSEHTAMGECQSGSVRMVVTQGPMCIPELVSTKLKSRSSCYRAAVGLA